MRPPEAAANTFFPSSDTVKTPIQSVDLTPHFILFVTQVKLTYFMLMGTLLLRRISLLEIIPLESSTVQWKTNDKVQGINISKL